MMLQVSKERKTINATSISALRATHCAQLAQKPRDAQIFKENLLLVLTLWDVR